MWLKLVCNSHDQIKITEIGTSDDKDWKTELIKTILGSKKNHNSKSLSGAVMVVIVW